MTAHNLNNRRYDIDWLRVIALGLLILYHVVLSFQPWAYKIFFIQNEEPLTELWLPMAMLNVWRIPILFVVSGMGVYFALRNRDWKQLLQDRALRILLPFLAGIFLICPISVWFALQYYGQPVTYVPNAGHLWFLGNIFVYVLMLLPLLIYLKNTPHSWVNRTIDWLLQRYWGIYLCILPLVLETLVLRPEYYFSYAQTAHGFFLGLLCFVMGFLLISRSDLFWHAVQRIRHSALIIASSLYLVRLLVYELDNEPNALMALESGCWMFVVLAYTALYLNKNSGLLRYLSQAVYPVYILHMPVQFGLACYLFPVALSAAWKFLLLLVGTYMLSFLLYEGGKRLGWLRVLFGMR